ncbi:uncharacterized protein APUU_10188S [Aspergillus puulaauensis]|uniref:F-box domain-containing protein n=1 Tax=Aspergillus puulaauensis TaxID=1220207 RepID=A0A7R7X9W2_9EURO|nr:uncharacterized protein APUU_10188S [Aspergillus puulaauensis]BCS17360.1 hypothetical protein APUU_10188S [Aspergillus puulaauensis]
MRDPIDLPPELFTEIITLALQRPPPADTNTQNHDIAREYDFNSGTNIPHLSQLTLINRQWHDLLLPTLYARYTHNGARHSYTSLWRFVRTVISNPRIAVLVRALSIGNWGFYPDVIAHDNGVIGDNVDFTEGEVEMMRRAFTRGDVLEAKVLDPESLAERDCRPLVALLLVCLSKVETVYLHLPEECSVLRCVFEELLRRQDEGGELPCLRHLVHLHLLAEVPVYGPEKDVSLEWPEPALRLDNVWPCIYFSGLRTLALYNLETEGIASLLAKNQGRICQVESLSIVVKSTPTRSSADVLALVNLPQSLTSFSIYWDHNIRNHITRQRDPAPVILVTELWDALQKHRESLEELAVLYKVHQNDEPLPGHFGSLQAFPRLKRLDTQLNILLDGMTPDRFAPFRLKDTIPENLDTLVLHPGWVDEIDLDFPDTEFQALVSERRRPLKCLVIDDYLAVPYYTKAKITDEGGVHVGIEPNGPEPYPGLWELCKQAGTQLHVAVGCIDTCFEGPCEFHQGGACQWLWRKTWNIRVDGIQRNRDSVERLRKKKWTR